ncbi:MAG: glycosyltransferase family 2 protein [Proteobacteria bacterium]|nr:glycosyltransferase family 2 protein [Pseudomonadota bacterium]
MFEGKSVAVVVPAYNEERLIGRVVETMPDFVDRIYVVDDCSRDETCGIVRGYHDRDALKERLVLLEHQANSGVGAALRTGYRQALDDGMDVVAVMAGDAQMDPDELDKVIGPVARGEADYVKGNRLFTGEAWRVIPRYRFLGNSVLSLLTKVASGYWHVADSQTGYTAISKEALALLPLDKLYPRYGYPNHMLVMLNVFNQRVRDVPIRPVYNVGEVSGIRLRKVVPTIAWLLVNCFWWRMLEKYVIRDFHPLVFFYFLAAVLLPPGLIIGFYLIVFRLLVGPVAVTSALFAVFLTVSGLQFMLFAMMFDMEYNRELR